jgi:hypothetical protein
VDVQLTPSKLNMGNDVSPIFYVAYSESVDGDTEKTSHLRDIRSTEPATLLATKACRTANDPEGKPDLEGMLPQPMLPRLTDLLACQSNDVHHNP